MVAAGIALMALMMGGMLLMHLGGHGHSGHGSAQDTPGVAVSTSTASGGAPHEHHADERSQP